jgi:hypothetical protein
MASHKRTAQPDNNRQNCDCHHDQASHQYGCAAAVAGLRLGRGPASERQRGSDWRQDFELSRQRDLDHYAAPDLHGGTADS